MACTTILVGKKASYDGSTMIARNDDSGSGHFTPKKFVVIHPEEQPKTYKSVISHVTIELPDDPMRSAECRGAAAENLGFRRQLYVYLQADDCLIFFLHLICPPCLS